MPGRWSMDTIGPISRTVEDCAMTLQAIAGHDPKDPYTWKLPVPDYRKALDGNIKGVKVGVVREFLYSDLVESETREAVVKAISVLGELGALVEEVSIPLSTDTDARAFSTALRVEAPLRYRELLRHRFQELGHDIRVGFLVGSIIPAQTYYKAQKLRALFRQQFLEVLAKVDVLVLPTVGIAAQKVVPQASLDRSKTIHRHAWLLTHMFSLANTAALSVCCGFTSQNLPIGLQIGGRPAEDGMVMKVAHAYEQNTPWHTRKPPI